MQKLIIVLYIYNLVRNIIARYVAIIIMWVRIFADVFRTACAELLKCVSASITAKVDTIYFQIVSSMTISLKIVPIYYYNYYYLLLFIMLRTS